MTYTKDSAITAIKVPPASTEGVELFRISNCSTTPEGIRPTKKIPTVAIGDVDKGIAREGDGRRR